MKHPLHWLAAALLAAALPAHAAGNGVAADQIARGEYLAHAGDCVACHTAPGGKPFAGGLAMKMPIGTAYSTNITPDAATGIGKYSYADFVRAVREGVAPDGRRLYPAMPYPSYARVSDADMQALYAYFMNAVPAVSQPNRATTMWWPMSIRWPLAIWNKLFVGAQEFTPDPARGERWNRGAYLVEGLGHCGSCHTPRGLAYQEKALSAHEGALYLSGAKVDGWFAKSLRADVDDGLGKWSEADIVSLLKTGRTGSAAAAGSMTEVVLHSTQFLTDADLGAIAYYLKSFGPARAGAVNTAAGSQAAVDRTLAVLRDGDYAQRGAAGYMEFCVTCHRADGGGYAQIYPSLADNPSIEARDPTSLIRVILAGGSMVRTRHLPTAYTMPAFHGVLSDREVADIVSFVRAGWGNQAAPVSADDVKAVRASIEP